MNNELKQFKRKLAPGVKPVLGKKVKNTPNSNSEDNENEAEERERASKLFKMDLRK